MNLHIDISSLREKVEPSIFGDYELELSFPEDKIEKCKINGRTKIIDADHGLYVSGKLKVMLQLVCSRCIDTFTYNTGVNIEEMCQYEEEDPCENYFVDKDTLDLKEILRQKIILSLPSKPLCKSDCEGLCRKCGINLNRETCNCSKVQPDPRWINLKEKFKNL